MAWSNKNAGCSGDGRQGLKSISIRLDHIAEDKNDRPLRLQGEPLEFHSSKTHVERSSDDGTTYKHGAA